MIGALAIATIAAAVLSDEDPEYLKFRETYRTKPFWFALAEWDDGTQLVRIVGKRSDEYRGFQLKAGLLGKTKMVFSTLKDEVPFVSYVERPNAFVVSYLWLEKSFPVLERSPALEIVKQELEEAGTPLERPSWVSLLMRRTPLERAKGQLPVGLREESALRGPLYDLLPILEEPSVVRDTDG